MQPELSTASAALPLAPADAAAQEPTWLPLGAVVLVHAVLLAGLAASVQPPQPVTPPAVIGVLVPAPQPVEPPKPLPMAPEPPRPQPVLRKPTPLPPIPNAPPSERAVTAPPAQATAPVEAAAPPAAPPAPPAPPAPVAPPALPETPPPVTPPRTDAAYLNNPEPPYPSISKRLNEQGRVMLDVYVLPDGSAGEVKLKRSSGFERLDKSALATVIRWRFVPARRGDAPIPFWYVVPVDFSLTS